MLQITRPAGAKGVLFLCRDNGARSQMAEAILNAFCGGSMRGHSAGIKPLAQIAEPVLQVIESHGIRTQGLRPKPWGEFDGADSENLEFVISICDPEAGEACAYWPGQPLRAHWHMHEPREGADLNEYYRSLDASFDHIFRCVNGFLNLPIEVMQKFALTRNEAASPPFVPDHLRITRLPVRAFAENERE
jgi:protein-tyrosine-phosphatase